MQQAKLVREEKEQLAKLPDDLRALVEAQDLSLPDAIRRSKLPERHAKLVAAGDLSLDEAEHLCEREEREHREALERGAAAIESFLFGLGTAANLLKNANREGVLSLLSDFDRERFLKIEKEIVWPTTR